MTITDEIRQIVVADFFSKAGVSADELPGLVALKSHAPAVQAFREKLGDAEQDPLLSKFADWREKGGSDIGRFLTLQTVDTQKVTDVEAIRLQLSMQFPTAPQEWLNAKLRSEYLHNISEDELKTMVTDRRIDSTDIDLKRGNVAIDGQKARDYIRSAQADDLKPRAAAAANDPAAMEALHREYRQAISQDVATLAATPISLKVSETQAFNYALTAQALEQASGAFVIEKDGMLLVDTAKIPRSDLLKAIALYQNRESMSTALANSVSSATEQSVRDEVSGRAPFGGTPGGDVSTLNPREAAIKAGLTRIMGS